MIGSFVKVAIVGSLMFSGYLLIVEGGSAHVLFGAMLLAYGGMVWATDHE
jgi:hypothetical protein